MILDTVGRTNLRDQLVGIEPKEVGRIAASLPSEIDRHMIHRLLAEYMLGDGPLKRREESSEALAANTALLRQSLIDDIRKGMTSEVVGRGLAPLAPLAEVRPDVLSDEAVSTAFKQLSTEPGEPGLRRNEPSYLIARAGLPNAPDALVQSLQQVLTTALENAYSNTDALKLLDEQIGDLLANYTPRTDEGRLDQLANEIVNRLRTIRSDEDALTAAGGMLATVLPRTSPEAAPQLRATFFGSLFQQPQVGIAATQRLSADQIEAIGKEDFITHIVGVAVNHPGMAISAIDVLRKLGATDLSERVVSVIQQLMDNGHHDRAAEVLRTERAFLGRDPDQIQEAAVSRLEGAAPQNVMSLVPLVLALDDVPDPLVERIARAFIGKTAEGARNLPTEVGRQLADATPALAEAILFKIAEVAASSGDTWIRFVGDHSKHLRGSMKVRSADLLLAALEGTEFDDPVAHALQAFDLSKTDRERIAASLVDRERTRSAVEQRVALLRAARALDPRTRRSRVAERLRDLRDSSTQDDVETISQLGE